MTEAEVVALMKGSTSTRDWNDRCDLVKAACGGYPEFWWQAIQQSGIAARVQAQFND